MDQAVASSHSGSRGGGLQGEIAGSCLREPAKDGRLRKMPDVYLTDSADLETKFTSDLETRARAALSRSRIYVLRKLHIELDGDAVILRGRVDSFYHKQLAQELVRMAVEGTEVINAISVVYNHRADDAALGMHW